MVKWHGLVRNYHGRERISCLTEQLSGAEMLNIVRMIKSSRMRQEDHVTDVGEQRKVYIFFG